MEAPSGLSDADIRLLPTMPLHAITSVYAEAGLGQRPLIEIAALPAADGARVDRACSFMSLVHAGEWNVTLGAAVTAFDFAAFYTSLGATVAGSPAQLQFDSQGIHGAAAVVASSLLALRAEPLKAALDVAIAARANAYYAKYANQAAIIAMAQQSYSPTVAGSKPALLADLSSLAQQQASQLQAAYTADARLGVVRTTISQLQGTSTTQEQSVSETEIETGTSIDTGTSVSETTQSKTSGSVETQSQTAGYAGPPSRRPSSRSTLSP